MRQDVTKETIKNPRTGVLEIHYWIKPKSKNFIIDGKKYCVNDIAEKITPKTPRSFSSYRAKFQESLE